MKKIIYTRPDGGLSIVHPVKNTHPVLEDITDDQCLERAKKDIPIDAIGIQIIEESEIPRDRTFRDAWKAGQGTIEHDVDKCKEIHKNRLRAHRKSLLESLDADFMKALEDGDSTKVALIKAKKQVLRDITKHPDLIIASTPEAIKIVWPFES